MPKKTPPPRPETLGARVRESRKNKGLTQVELSAMLGVTQGKLSELEVGRRLAESPPLETVRRLARALGVSTDYLLGMSDQP